MCIFNFQKSGLLSQNQWNVQNNIKSASVMDIILSQNLFQQFLTFENWNFYKQVHSAVLHFCFHYHYLGVVVTVVVVQTENQRIFSILQAYKQS